MLRKSSLVLSLFASISVVAASMFVNVPSQVGAQSRPAQVEPQSKALQPASEAEVGKIIDGLVLTVKGQQFPKLASKTTAKASSCCQPYDTKNVKGMADIQLSTPQGYAKKKFIPPDGPRERVYGLDPCWRLVSYQRQVLSSNPPFDASADSQPANFHYLSNTEYDAVLNETKNYVLNLDILGKYKANLNVKLEEFVKNYAKYASEIKTSHGQVRHWARVQGRGIFNGSSNYHGQINTVEICCPPEVTDAPTLKTTLKAWVDEAVKRLKAFDPVKGHQVTHQ